MVQVNILSGKKAGTCWAARRFPVRIGRSAAADLQLDDPGVWDEHLELRFAPREGFLAVRHPDALVTVDGQPVEHRLLHNGDVVEMGGVRVQFWLARTRQASLGFREWAIWAGIAVVCLGQVALIYWLLTA